MAKGIGLFRLFLLFLGHQGTGTPFDAGTLIRSRFRFRLDGELSSKSVSSVVSDSFLVLGALLLAEY